MVSADLARVRAADEVVYGSQRGENRRQLWYSLYVTALVCGLYCFPLVQGLLVSTNPAWLREHLGWFAFAGVGFGAAAILALLSWIGQVRGPVTPALPRLELVASTSIDRALVLRRSWSSALITCLVAGMLASLVVWGSVVYAGMAPVWSLVAASILGAVLGWAAARSWLSGQVRASAGALGSWAWSVRVRDSLRQLSLVDMQAHSAMAATMATQALTGDLRSLRLSLSPAVRRARGTRLGAAGPVLSLVRRDLLGLRRAPLSFMVGAVSTIAAAGVLTLTFAFPAVPAFVAGVGALSLHLGVGAWNEGSRIQADHAPLPRLLGVSDRMQALAHLCAPGGLAFVGTVSVQVVLAVVGIVPWGPGSLWPLALVPLALSTSGAAAFRGLPSTGPLLTNASLYLVAAVWMMPAVAAVAVATVSAYRVGRLGWPGWWATVAATVVCFWWAQRRVVRLSEPDG